MKFFSSIWNSPTKRSALMQILLLSGIGLFVLYIVNNTIANLENRGITSGFSFLDQEAGFDVSFSLLEYSPESSILKVFIVGLFNTLLVSSFGILIATILGFTLGISRLSTNWLLAKISLIYIETLRNIPLLLQIFFWYFAVIQTLPSTRQSYSIGDTVFLNIRGLYLPKPDDETFYLGLAFIFLFGALFFSLSRISKVKLEKTGNALPMGWISLATIILLPIIIFGGFSKTPQFEAAVLSGFNYQGGWVIIPELAALLLALSLYTAAFIGEIVRAGILAVSKGQLEAADSLGLKKSHTIRLVIVPQALRIIIPPLTNQFLNLTKNSTLAAAIGYPDLVLLFSGIVLGQVGQAVEVVGMMMVTYLILSLLISLLMNWYNQKTAIVGK